METIQQPPVSSFREKIRSWSLLSRFSMGPGGVKVTVIVLFTVCWLLVVLVRANGSRHEITPEGSSLIALATSFQQGAVSGRDFQSNLGPATQFLAWMASLLSNGGSAFDAYGMILFFFGAASALLIAAMLLVCDTVSWRESAVVYVFCFLLNLFFQVLDLRTALLLLNAAFAYRITAAETRRSQMIWATAAGLLCFVSQLVTMETGIYSIIVVICALISGAVLTRNVREVLGIQAFVTTLAMANVGLVLLFKLTSGNYGLVFDYQNYSLEILRGYHNSMGVLWQLPSRQTIVLALATLYVIGMCIVVAVKSDPLYASLFAGFAFASVIRLNWAFVSSDIAHVTAAFTPMVVVLGLLATRAWGSKQEGAVWALAVAALLFVWPAFNLNAPVDLFQTVSGSVPLRAAFRNLYSPEKAYAATLLPDWMNSLPAERSDIPILAFPYDNHIVSGSHRPLFAPIMESPAASTEPLESHYIQALDKQRKAGLDVVYSQDTTDVPHNAGIQAITRTPRIFEYLYRHYELNGHEDHADGHYELRQRSHPRDAALQEIEFVVPHQLADWGSLKLATPSSCGLVRIDMRIEYGRNPLIFRPSGVDVSFSDGDQLIWRGSIRALEPNASFTTFISPMQPGQFHKVFGEGPIPSMKWDRIEYRNAPADALGSTARRILVESLQCVDPQKFVEGPSTRL